MRPPPLSTLAQNFCTSAAQGRSAASDGVASATVHSPTTIARGVSRVSAIDIVFLLIDGGPFLRVASKPDGASRRCCRSGRHRRVSLCTAALTAQLLWGLRAVNPAVPFGTRRRTVDLAEPAKLLPLIRARVLLHLALEVGKRKET